MAFSNFFLHVVEKEWPSLKDWVLLSLFSVMFLFWVNWVRHFCARILPGRIQIIAVKIVKKKRGLVSSYYWFKGGKVAHIIKLIPYLAPPVSLTIRGSIFEKLNFSKFRNRSHKILYLDEKRQIALAAEKCRGGGAVLLDEDLTHLKLNEREKRELVTSLKKEQEILAKDRQRLNQIIKAIPEPRPVFRWEKNAAKKKKQLQEK